MVDKQDTIEMVHLMLDAGRKEPVHILFANLVLAVEIADADPFGTFYLGKMLRQGQASFFEHAAFARCLYDFRVCHLHRLRRLPRSRDIGDDHPFGYAHLRRRQTDAGGGVHGFQHVIHEPPDIVIDGVDARCNGFEARIRRCDDGQQGHRNEIPYQQKALGMRLRPQGQVRALPDSGHAAGPMRFATALQVRVMFP